MSFKPRDSNRGAMGPESLGVTRLRAWAGMFRRLIDSGLTTQATRQTDIHGSPSQEQYLLSANATHGLHFSRAHKAFFKEYKEIEMPYEIISPDAFLRPYIENYSTLLAIYHVVPRPTPKGCRWTAPARKRPMSWCCSTWVRTISSP